jgi:16S rRNA (adenine1518-N6/adenine1519-N6)-dimethyltransferase
MTFPGVLLKQHGLRASKRKGQNFLTQPATARAIAHSACIKAEDTVLEIGAGLGALTLALAAMAKKVQAVEVDRGVFPVLKGILAENGVQNVDVMLQDALDLDLVAMARENGSPFVVVGNLPYSISSPILFKLLDNLSAWRSATVMVQKEVADRLVCEPGNKNYGRMSVLIQTWCRTGHALTVGPDQFFPRPAVASSVVHLVPRKENLARLTTPEEAAWFKGVVKAAFGQRRKTLLNSISSGLAMDKAKVTSALNAVSISPSARAETLNPASFAELARSLADRV